MSEEREEPKEKFDRPEVLRGITALAKTPCGKLYVTITEHEGKPIETFLEMGKGGACQNAMMEGFGRVITKALQWGTPIDEIANSLGGIRCGSSKMQNPSCLARVAGKLKLGNNIRDFWKEKEEKKDEG